jgi:hypothetical protein
LNHRYNKKHNSFSLIEVILYVAILSIFLGGVVTFAWDAIYSNLKSEIQQNITNNGKFATSKISKLIRNSDGISSVTATSLTLDMNESDPTKHPTEITYNSNRIYVGYGSDINCPTTNPCPITSNNVSVSAFDIQNLSTANTDNVRITVTVDSVSERQEFQDTQTFNSTAKVR